MKILSSCITALSLFILRSFAKEIPDQDIVILYTNDVHCAINETIGYAGLSYYRDEMVKLTPYVTLVDVGDHVQGGTIGSLSEGKYIIDIMNAVGYDIATPGNHEFDYGISQFVNFAENLSCGYLSCNFRNVGDGKLVLKPYRIREFGKVKVAFLGISTPESIVKSVPTVFMDSKKNFIFDFDGDSTGEKLVATVQEAVNNARDEGADYVVAVAHLGEGNGITKEWSAPFVVEHTSGIDVLIDGHSHEKTPKLLQKNAKGEEVPITQAGSRLEYIGKVTINTEGEVDTELVDKSQVASRDEEIDNLIREIEGKYENILSEVIGYTDFLLNDRDEDGNRLIRKEETNLVNLITDALLTESVNYGKADIAFCNGGNIRAPIKIGDITYGNAIDVLPYTSPACIVEVSGQDIINALEMSARNFPLENGGFLHTAGISYTINTAINSTVVTDENGMFQGVAGKHRVQNIRVADGSPIDPEKRYKIIADEYILLQNGDGYVFEGPRTVNSGFALPNELLISYIKKLNKEDMEEYREPQGRLTFIDVVEDETLNAENPEDDKTGEKTTTPTTTTTTGEKDEGSSAAQSIRYDSKLSGIVLMVSYLLYRRLH